MNPTGLMAPAAHPGSRIVVVDDEQANLDLIDRVLARQGYRHVVLTTDPRWMLNNLDDLDPDLVVLDLHMPDMDGFEVLRRLETAVPAAHLVPRLVVTADSTASTRRTALALGAHDFLTKPIDVTETALRVANLLATRMLHVRLREQNQQLESQVQARTQQLQLAHTGLVQRLALVGEYRDDVTSEHAVRVGTAAHRLATALGLPTPEARLLGEAAPLHDIGKVSIPDAVLLKPGPLTPAEFHTIKGHAAAGAHILAGGESELLRLAEQVALTHHERWDGTGYPQGLAGDAIPLAGRLVAVVDVFDALTSQRPYKPAWTPDHAASHMLAQRARHFDPELLDVFLSELDDVDQSPAVASSAIPRVAGGSATVNVDPVPGRLSTSR